MADLMRILMQINVKTLIRRYFQRGAHCRPYLILFYKQLKMYKSGWKSTHNTHTHTIHRHAALLLCARRIL